MNIMATSFVEDLTFPERVEVCGRSYPSRIFLWNFQDMHLFSPVLALESPLEITTFEFKPHDPNIVVGGAINGQLILWDISKYMNPASPDFIQAQKSTEKNELNTVPGVKPVLFSSLPSNYNIPPVVPPEGINRKIVNSHKSAITSINFLPAKVEFERKNKLVFVEKTNCKYHLKGFLTL